MSERAKCPLSDDPIPLTPEQLKQLCENDPYEFFFVNGTKHYVIPQELTDNLSAPVGLEGEEA